jgi:DNA invertase Pin-like site-specific DNA recombinase
MSTTTRPQPGRATIYARLSHLRAGEEADDEDNSVERQVKACERYCGERGWQVVQVHREENVSGYKRVATPELEAALDDIERGRADVLLVWKLDRLTRRGIGRAGVILDKAEAASARIVSVVDHVDTSASSGQLLFSILVSVARAESENTSIREKAANYARAQQGKWHGSGRSYGYSEALEVVEAEAREVRDMARRVLSGASLRSIAADLNDRGVRALRGGTWEQGQVRELLLAPKLRGARAYHGQVVQNVTPQWEPVLSEDEQLAVLAILNDPARRCKPPLAAPRLLVGLVRCGSCGMALSAVKHGRSYGCTAGPGRKNCGHVCVTLAGLDRFVIGEVVRALAVRSQAQPVHPDDGGDRQAALDHDQAQLVTLTRRRFVETGELAVGDQEYRAAKRLLDARMAATRQELDRLGSLAQGVAHAWSAQLAEALAKGNGPGYQRELVRALMERVEVRRAPCDPGTGRAVGSRVFDPARVTVVWKEPYGQVVEEVRVTPPSKPLVRQGGS